MNNKICIFSLLDGLYSMCNPSLKRKAENMKDCYESHENRFQAHSPETQNEFQILISITDNQL